jgi:hypothetical protein
MGIYPQPNLWQCGPFALKHALLVHGILINEREISRLAGSHWWNGTDEVQLARVARRYGSRLEMVRKLDADLARRELVGYLRRGVPALLCVYEWTHWVTAVKEEKGQFILLDSRNPAVVTIATWPQLRAMWVYHEPDEYDADTVHTFYDLHPVIPRGRVTTRARFSLARARYLRRKANRTFARLWDVYVNDLLAICKPRTPRSTKVLSMGEFFRRHETMLLDQVDYWHGGVERSAARRVLHHLHFVADTYGLVIQVEAEKRAIAGISVLLGLWAAGEYGVNGLYREAKRKR